MNDATTSQWTHPLSLGSVGSLPAHPGDHPLSLRVEGGSAIHEVVFMASRILINWGRYTDLWVYQPSTALLIANGSHHPPAKER